LNTRGGKKAFAENTIPFGEKLGRKKRWLHRKKEGGAGKGAGKVARGAETLGAWAQWGL